VKIPCPLSCHHVCQIIINYIDIILQTDLSSRCKTDMGVSDLQSYYRWNAVCGESRTCGVDLNEIPRRIVRDDEEVVELTIDEKYSAEFTSETQVDEYSFYAESGKTYIIDTDVDEYVNGTYVDTVIELFDSEESLIAEDDDDDQELDPYYEYNESYLVFQCNESGDYYLKVYEYSNWDDGAGELGRYNIIVREVPGADGIGSSLIGVTESVDGTELYLEFSRPLFPQDPLNLNHYYTYGPSIDYVDMSEDHLSVTFYLDSAIEDDDRIAGQSTLVTVDNIGINGDENEAIRAGGEWVLEKVW